MIVVEQQLLTALRETPLETDCSVSVDVLKNLGHRTVEKQLLWLTAHRPATEGKRWRCTGEHWEFSAETELKPDPVSSALPVRATTSPGLAAKPIVVKPLTPLAKRRA